MKRDGVSWAAIAAVDDLERFMGRSKIEDRYDLYGNKD
jgi:hypothetical protein